MAALYAWCGDLLSHDWHNAPELDGVTHALHLAAENGHARHLLHALDLYYRFCSLDLEFDNHRLLEEGVPAPPQFRR